MAIYFAWCAVVQLFGSFRRRASVTHTSKIARLPQPVREADDFDLGTLARKHEPGPAGSNLVKPSQT